MAPTRRAVLRRIGILGGVGALAVVHDGRLGELLDRECVRLDAREMYGPTDLSCQTSNGRLAAGLNDSGTVTVLRYPYPSTYDQVSYFTEGRADDDGIVVDPADGCFLGVAPVGGETTWLRDSEVLEHGYARDDEGVYADEVRTVYQLGDATVTVEDLVGQSDALVRRVTLEATEPHRLVWYANLALTVTKRPQMPIEDWCLSSDPTETSVGYDGDLDAVVHERSGVDETLGADQSVALAVGFDTDSEGHVVASDALELARSPLDGPSAGDGATATAIETTIDPGQSVAAVLAAGRDASAAADTLASVREESISARRAAKEEWLESRLADAPLPDTDDERLAAFCRRALVTLVTDTEDRASRAVVASISTQPPYGLDWVRDGAYFNRVLELAGLEEWVTEHNRWYASIQQPADRRRESHPRTPPGNWAMNYYGDGVAGGPIPYQIDQTAYGIWTLWTHYERVDDESYLADVYPAIELAAEHCVRCVDERTLLHCETWEDDRPMPQRPTVVGAGSVWMGLGAAARAARHPESPGTAADGDRYEERRHEIGRAIDRHCFGPVGGSEPEAYGTRIGSPIAEVAWPVRFRPYADRETGAIRDRPQVDEPLEHPRMRSHMDRLAAGLEDVRGVPDEPYESGHGQDTDQYETKATVPLAMSGEPQWEAAASETLEWVLEHHARDDTLVMGEAWQVLGSDRTVESIVGQPHVWSQLLAYLTALELDSPADYGGLGWTA